MDFAIKNDAMLGEIPIHFKERTTGNSKIIVSQYSFQTLLYVFKIHRLLNLSLLVL